MKAHIELLLLLSLTTNCLLLQAQSFDFQFDHFAIVVADVDKSAEFYATVLNLEETPHPDRKPGFRWFIIDDNTQIHLIQKEFAPFEKNKSMHLALATQDLDGLIAHLKSKNVVFDDFAGNKNTIKHRSDGVDQIYIRDPDGYWIEINTVVH
ncbi:VOC family protein [Pricia sp. S334]|uniref:VOC family protein n=1 Tax=Pricia mediterranea TaxID=3076079 RepID=A0ABU3L9B9_9FLAO|nr:VOC family protein [Pricia sp. S334]MDT7830087.1 VOC family protein [Pricia sp. S334]